MAASWPGSLPRRFARRAAEELASIYGIEGARARLAERIAGADADDARLLGDILAALDDLKRRSLS
jgi:hypothetical protein